MLLRRNITFFCTVGISVQRFNSRFFFSCFETVVIVRFLRHLMPCSFKWWSGEWEIGQDDVAHYLSFEIGGGKKGFYLHLFRSRTNFISFASSSLVVIRAVHYFHNGFVILTDVMRALWKNENIWYPYSVPKHLTGRCLMVYCNIDDFNCFIKFIHKHLYIFL